MKKNVIIDLKNISVTFGDNQVLKNLNLYIRENEFLTLLGPSGCGKTTTLRILGGFETPDKGQVIFEGRDITNLPPNKRNLNTVFQKYALFPHMTIAENIAFGLKISGKSKSYINDKIKYALKLVNLDGFENRMPDSLSGGQQQRILKDLTARKQKITLRSIFTERRAYLCKFLFQLEGIVHRADQLNSDSREHGIEREAGAEEQAGGQHDSPEHADEIEQQRIEPVREQPQHPAAKVELAVVFRAQERSERRADQDQRKQRAARDAVGHIGGAGDEKEHNACRGRDQREGEELGMVKLPDHVQAVDQRVQQIDHDHVARPEDGQNQARDEQQRERRQPVAADRPRKPVFQQNAQHKLSGGQRQKHIPLNAEHRIKRRKALYGAVIAAKLPKRVNYNDHQHECGGDFIDNGLILRLFCSSFVLCHHSVLSFDSKIYIILNIYRVSPARRRRTGRR